MMILIFIQNRKNANMILIKRCTFLNLVFGIVAITTINSCASRNREIIRSNKFSEGFMNEYSNTSLKVKVSLYGNAIIGAEHISFRKFRRELRAHQLHMPKNVVLWGTYEAVD